MAAWKAAHELTWHDSYTRHDSCIRVAWRIRTGDLTHVHLWRGFLLRQISCKNVVTPFVAMLWHRHMIDCLYLTWLIHCIYITPLIQCICTTRFIHCICITPLIRRLIHTVASLQECCGSIHTVASLQRTHIDCIHRIWLIICVTWRIHMCDMTHSYVGHGSLCVWQDASICVTRLIHTCTMTHSHVRHDSFTRTCDIASLRIRISCSSAGAWVHQRLQLLALNSCLW